MNQPRNEDTYWKITKILSVIVSFLGALYGLFLLISECVKLYRGEDYSAILITMFLLGTVTFWLTARHFWRRPRNPFGFTLRRFRVGAVLFSLLLGFVVYHWWFKTDNRQPPVQGPDSGLITERIIVAEYDVLDSWNYRLENFVVEDLREAIDTLQGASGIEIVGPEPKIPLQAGDSAARALDAKIVIWGWYDGGKTDSSDSYVVTHFVPQHEHKTLKISLLKLETTVPMEELSIVDFRKKFSENVTCITLWTIALIRYQSEDYLATDSLLERILSCVTESEQEENRFAVHFYMANSQALQGNFAEAAKVYKRVVNYNRIEKHRAYYNLSLVQLNQGLHREAMISLESALALKPDYELASALGDRIQMVFPPWPPEPVTDTIPPPLDSILDSALPGADPNLDTPRGRVERRSQQLVQSWYNRGDSLLQAMRYERSIAYFDSAISYRRDYVHAWYNRGRAHHFLARYDSALTSYNVALRYDSSDYTAWCGRALALSNLDRHLDAIASCDSSLKYRPGFAYAWHSRAFALMRLDRYCEAVTSYESALVYNPSNDKIRLERNRALRRCAEDPANRDSVLNTQPRNSW